MRKSLTALAVAAGSLSAAMPAAQAAAPHSDAIARDAVAPLPAPGTPVAGNGAIYAETGSGFGPVTGGPGEGCVPTMSFAAWSADGSRLACVNALGPGMLRTYTADGTITTAGSINGNQIIGVQGNPEGMTWFRHGTEVVVGLNQTLYAVRVDGTQPRNADNSYVMTPMFPGMTGGYPSANADGTLLLFKSQTGPTLYDATKPAGANLQTLTQLSGAVNLALSPNGRYVAFDSMVNNVWQLSVYDLQSPASASNPRQLTTDTTVDHTMPTWSPDGTRLAFYASPAGNLQTSSLVSLAVANPTSQQTEMANFRGGVYAWRPKLSKPVERLAGSDRVGTAITTSQAAWETAGASGSGRRMAKSVTISRSDLFADALGGAGFAAHQQGPLLLTDPHQLQTATLNELQRVLGPGSGPTGPTVYLLGGEGALSPAVKAALDALHYNVVRLGGGDRFSTAVTIAKQDSGLTPKKVLVATGMNYPDALAAGAAAGANQNAVVVLTDNTTMPKATADYLNSVGGATLYGVGGQAVTALTGRTSVSLKGVDRVDTSLLVARNLFDTPQSAGFATSANWPDSLAGGALQGTVGGPLLLVDPSGLSQAESDWLMRAGSSIESAQIYGGPAAVPGIERTVGQDIADSAGYTVK